MRTVMLRVDVDGKKGAQNIWEALTEVPGVVSMKVNVKNRLVAVDGTADAAALKAQIEARLGLAVTVESDGTDEGSGAGASANYTEAWSVDATAGTDDVDEDLPPPLEADDYYPGAGGYGFQDWTAPYQSTGGYYDYPGQGGVYGGQQWTTPDYQQWTSGYYNYSQGEGPPGDVVYDQYQQGSDENAGSNCCIQ